MPFLSLTTDFGHAYTAICEGVIYTIVPSAKILVLSDEVTPYGTVEGALLLRQALPYLPVGVHVAVVDPGVGTSRRPVAITTARGDTLVGPDNGLLVPAAEALGGVARAHVIQNAAYRLPEVSTSFHGRDIFSPAAAHLATGIDLADLGEEAGELASPNLPEPAVGDGELITHVLYTDRFGSLILSATENDLGAALGRVDHGTVLDVDSARIPYESTYGSVPEGQPLLWIDSSGHLGLAVNKGSAAERFALSDGTPVTIRRAE